MIPRGVDWHTRKVLAWRISNTLEAEFCVDALNEAIHKFGLPQIMKTDQGSQFTSFAWTDRLRRSGVRISPLMHVNMHCRGSGWTAKVALSPLMHLRCIAGQWTTSLSNDCGGL